MPTRSPLTRLLTAMSAVGFLLSGAGCQTLSDAGTAIDPADLVNELATRLDAASGQTYSADYQLSGGETARIVQAQQPIRVAYTYPDGKLIVTVESTTRCATEDSRTVCTLSPAPATGPVTAAFADASEHGLVTPPVVIDLLAATALEPKAIVKQNDTTIAGRHATCVQVSQVQNAAASSFATCVTTEGVLGSFTGVVDGQAIDIAISQYRDTVDANAFDLPSGAHTVGRQPGDT